MGVKTCFSFLMIHVGSGSSEQHLDGTTASRLMISLLVTGEKWLNCATWRVWITGGGAPDVACRILSVLADTEAYEVVDSVTGRSWRYIGGRSSTLTFDHRSLLSVCRTVHARPCKMRYYALLDVVARDAEWCASCRGIHHRTTATRVVSGR